LDPTIRRKQLPLRPDIASAVATHSGLVRSVNEDAVLDRAAIGLWAVADGVGGANAGDHASRTVVACLSAVPRLETTADLAERTRLALKEANHQLRRDAKRLSRGRVIASTVVCLLISGYRFQCLWAGDSRLYRLHLGRLERVSRDHSEVQSLLEYGLITAEEAEHHPSANRITRAVGAECTLDLDCVEGDIERGDCFLLCSDGLTKVVSDVEIATVLDRFDPVEINERLIGRALQRGGPDNVSVVAVKIAAASGGNP
jgi:serine/threonine protein phosphatase PrpC